MSTDDSLTEELKQRQRSEEEAERSQIAAADTDAEADRHRRRAEKAQYLRQKLEEREQSERGAEDEEGTPSG